MTENQSERQERMREKEWLVMALLAGDDLKEVSEWLAEMDNCER